MDAFLILEDKTIFRGKLIGYPKETSGEVVFTTGMVGYPEALTDPSYKGQILTFTYPLIGNYGIPEKIYSNKIIQNFESENIHAEGVIMTYCSVSSYHWQSKITFSEWLKKNKIPGIAGIDTRLLTQKLREKGTMLGEIRLANKGKREFRANNPNKTNLVKNVSISRIETYKGTGKKIVVLDCGIKMGIIRSLRELGVTIIRIPWNYDPLDHKLEFDGFVISNGPGDPKKLTSSVKIIKRILDRGIPTLGICLGNQLLALAIGGNTYKLKYGHRSANQPCLLRGTNRAFVTSQNHGFAVDSESLPKGWQEWFTNLNDGTNEGIIHKNKPFASVQFHPEASPGPEDTKFIFKKFLSWVN